MKNILSRVSVGALYLELDLSGMSSSTQSEESSSILATAKKLDKLHNIERVNEVALLLWVCSKTGVCINVMKDIIKMLGLAAGAIDELSKESPSAEAVEYKTKDFVKTLEVC